MKLTPHEKTILELIRKHPDIVDNPSARKLVAHQYGFKEKTLRNRIGDLKKYGALDDLLLRINPIQSIKYLSFQNILKVGTTKLVFLYYLGCFGMTGILSFAMFLLFPFLRSF